MYALWFLYSLLHYRWVKKTIGYNNQVNRIKQCALCRSFTKFEQKDMNKKLKFRLVKTMTGREIY